MDAGCEEGPLSPANVPSHPLQDEVKAQGSPYPIRERGESPVPSHPKQDGVAQCSLLQDGGGEPSVRFFLLHVQAVVGRGC